MTDTLTTTPEGRAAVGDLLHVTVSGYTFAGRVWTRGDEFTLTAAMIENSLNRLGESSIDRELRHPDGRIVAGPWPGGPTWTPGSPEQDLARERARQDALSLPPRDRDAALREVRNIYGTAPTSHTTRGPSDPALARAAHEERQRDKQLADADKAKQRAARFDPDADSRLQELMDLGRAAAFDRELEAREILGDRGEARP